jgi:hypothetical protein
MVKSSSISLAFFTHWAAVVDKAWATAAALPFFYLCLFYFFSDLDIKDVKKIQKRPNKFKKTL